VATSSTKSATMRLRSSGVSTSIASARSRTVVRCRSNADELADAGLGHAGLRHVHTGGNIASGSPRYIRAIQSSDGETWSAPDSDNILAPVAGGWEGDWVYAQAVVKETSGQFNRP